MLKGIFVDYCVYMLLGIEILNTIKIQIDISKKKITQLPRNVEGQNVETILMTTAY